MNSYSPTPSAGRGRTARRTAKRSGAMPYMSEQQTQAYLLARDTVRRVQRTSSLVGAMSHKVAGNFSNFNWTNGDSQQSH